MRIVVTDLTRMQRGYVCVAGIDSEAGTHVRPVLGTARLSTTMLARHGGPFEMATLVDLGPTEPAPVKPELEDHEFSPRLAKKLEETPPDHFWRTLQSTAQPSLTAIFGPDLRRRGNGAAAVNVDTGSAWLGCLRPKGRPELYLKRRDGGQD